MHRGRIRALALLAVAGLTFSACGGGSSDDGGGGGGGNGGNKVDPAECGLKELAAASGPVDVTFWHTMARANREWLERETKAFNASQDKVNVKLVDIPGYQEALTKYRSGLSSGDLPDLVQLEETSVQSMLDSQSTIPMQACVDAAKFSLDAFLPRATGYYSSDGVLRAMPWTVSNPLLMWDEAKIVKAGLDPTKPPQTLDELRDWARKIVDAKVAKYGIALRVEPYVFEFLLAKSGGLYVNNGNGRTERATEAAFAGPEGTAIWTWWKEMVDDGLALNTGAAPNNFDHMLAIGNGNAAMTFEASGVLGIVRAVLESGQYPGVKIGNAPLPALTPGGGIPVGDGALWIPQASSLAERGAAWTFVEFLSSAEEQAKLSVDGGYVPVRTDAATQPDLVEKWKADPILRTAYDQLEAGPLNDSTVGSLIGDYQGVRDAVKQGLTSMLEGGASAKDAIGAAQSDATEAIQAYNSRLG